MDDNGFLARRQHAESTEAKVLAVRVLTESDFTKLMGSGMLIALTNYTSGGSVTDEFSINGEDMEVIKVEIIRSLRRSLGLRKVLLQQDIARIDDVLEKSGKYA